MTLKLHFRVEQLFLALQLLERQTYLVDLHIKPTQQTHLANCICYCQSFMGLTVHFFYFFFHFSLMIFQFLSASFNCFFCFSLRIPTVKVAADSYRFDLVLFRVAWLPLEVLEAISGHFGFFQSTSAYFWDVSFIGDFCLLLRIL